MISRDDLREIAEVDDWYMGVHLGEMAKELLKMRCCEHQWKTLRLVECGGSYRFCSLCGEKGLNNYA